MAAGAGPPGTGVSMYVCTHTSNGRRKILSFWVHVTLLRYVYNILVIHLLVHISIVGNTVILVYFYVCIVSYGYWTTDDRICTSEFSTCINVLKYHTCVYVRVLGEWSQSSNDFSQGSWVHFIW